MDFTHPNATILLLWLAFAATHLILASVRVEPRLRARLGQTGYLGLYSAVALGLFVPLFWVYLENRYAGPWFWAVPLHGLVLWACYLAMAFAITLIAGAFLSASPASIQGGSTKPSGVLAVTRHPLIMGLAIFGAIHVFMNGNAPSVAFFSGFVLFGFVGAWHQDARKLHHELPGFREFCASTQFFPLLSPASWRGLRAVPIWVWCLGVALATAIRWAHGPLLGV